MSTRVVLGVDGGGSQTRAVCVALDGTVLARATAAGSNPEHNADAQTHVQSAVRAVLQQAGVQTGDVAAFTAGLAGLNHTADLGWAREFTTLDNLVAADVINDSEVAHAGAFALGPGIIVIAGTGSIVLGRTESGRVVRNDWYEHYATSARNLVIDVMEHVLLGETGPRDDELFAALLAHWKVGSLDDLRVALRRGHDGDYDDVKRTYGSFAPVVTALAATSPLARAVCDRAASRIAVGVRLLGASFEGPSVPVVLSGAVAVTAAIAAETTRILAEHPRYQVVVPQLAPLEGAALLALRRAGVPVDQPLIDRLGAAA